VTPQLPPSNPKSPPPSPISINPSPHFPSILGKARSHFSLLGSGSHLKLRYAWLGASPCWWGSSFYMLIVVLLWLSQVSIFSTPQGAPPQRSYLTFKLAHPSGPAFLPRRGLARLLQERRQDTLISSRSSSVDIPSSPTPFLLGCSARQGRGD
jgi:hypothetical protein